MTPIRFMRENKHAVTIRNDDEDGANRGGFSGPAEVIDGIMEMQEEARKYRAAGIAAAAGQASHDMGSSLARAVLRDNGIQVKGTGTDRGAAAAVAQSVAATEDEPIRPVAATEDAPIRFVTIETAVWCEVLTICASARALRNKLDGVIGLPALADLGKAIDDHDDAVTKRLETADFGAFKLVRGVQAFANDMLAKLLKKKAEGLSGWDNSKDFTDSQLMHSLQRAVRRGDPVDVGNYAMMAAHRGLRTYDVYAKEDERKAIDKVDDQLAAEEAPQAENRVSIEELPYPELVMLLQSEQITTERYVEEMKRRAEARTAQLQEEADRHREHMRRFSFWFF